jgi:hypothetical protein
MGAKQRQSGYPKQGIDPSAKRLDTLMIINLIIKHNRTTDAAKFADLFPATV